MSPHETLGQGGYDTKQAYGIFCLYETKNDIKTTTIKYHHDTWVKNQYEHW